MEDQIMKKMTRILSLLLCLTVALSMSFAFPQKASAVSTATVKSGSTLKAVEYKSPAAVPSKVYAAICGNNPQTDPKR